LWCVGLEKNGRHPITDENGQPTNSIYDVVPSFHFLDFDIVVSLDDIFIYDSVWKLRPKNIGQPGLDIGYEFVFNFCETKVLEIGT
jgi:hypothetical protein